MKINIGFKVALLIIVILIVIVEFNLGFVKDKDIDEFKRFNQQNLVDLAKVIASNIDGDEHIKAIIGQDSSDFYYQKIKHYLENCKKALNFKEEIFTVFLHADSASCYGVKTNSASVARQLCEFRDKSLYPIFKRAFKENRSLYSDIYSDRNGMWISGFSPITNSKGEAVALVELDLSFNEYQEKLTTFTSWINYYRLISVIVSILIGSGVGLFFGKPIAKVSKAMDEISNDKSFKRVEPPRLSKLFPDEVAKLTNAFNIMSEALDKAIKDLNSAIARLSELSHSKSIFLSLISHELRTPLTGMAFIEFLKKNNTCSQDDNEMIEMVAESYLRLKEFSLAAEKYIKALNYTPPEQANCNPYNIILESIEEYSPKALEKSIKINFNSSELDVICSIEQSKLSEILGIVLDNAIKYSSAGSEVDIYLESNKNNTRIIVDDYGIGLNGENVENIFEPFGIDNINQHSKGSGLNLAMSKIILKKFGGDIYAVRKDKEKGVKFVIVLSNILSSSGWIQLSKMKLQN